MPPSMVPAAVPLHEFAHACGGISLISYNVLLPNSSDGWWVFKYYDQSTPNEARTWAHRQALLSTRLLGEMADIVCIQEASGDSFQADFSFMRQAGYSAVIHRKYRLRPATFWREDAFSCIHERHRDKVLITVLRSRHAPEKVVSVLNCHLIAAPDPARRFRQIFDALDQLRKDLNRLSIPLAEAAVVVCGDFNAAPGGSATHHLLSGGTVDAAFREPRWPDRSLSSKPRRHVFSAFSEVYLQTLGTAPVTLIGSRLVGLLTEDGQPSPALLQAVAAMFTRFAREPDRMVWSEVEDWLVRINRAPDRGSKHHKARTIVAERGEQWLSLVDFTGLYLSELSEGKYWSVLHDLQVCEVAPDGERALYTASLDRIYASGLEVVAAWDPLTEVQRSALLGGGLGLPDAWHPSDHLPIGAVLRM